MQDHHKKKKFLNLPRYGGGNTAFREFVAANLKYPPQAIEAHIEGFVIVEYDIHDDGTVRDPRILKGLGYGCDEEALRIVGLLRYEKVRNRGVRVKMTTKTRINFSLPKSAVQYTYQQTAPTSTGKQTPAGKDGQVTYSYTINLGG
jgi:TonB family protein